MTLRFPDAAASVSCASVPPSGRDSPRGAVPVVAVWLGGALPPLGPAPAVSAELSRTPDGAPGPVGVRLAGTRTRAEFDVPVGIALLLASAGVAGSGWIVPLALYEEPPPERWWAASAPPSPALIVAVPPAVFADALAEIAPPGYLTLDG